MEQRSRLSNRIAASTQRMGIERSDNGIEHLRNLRACHPLSHIDLYITQHCSLYKTATPP
jgi:hypothetical protein